jgi:hypothetical protein
MSPSASGADSCALSELPGTDVMLSTRRDRFARIRPKNHERLAAALEAERPEVLRSTQVRRIEPDSVVYENGAGPVGLPNDAVLVFAGGELPTPFLRSCGIEIETKFGRP